MWMLGPRGPSPRPQPYAVGVTVYLGSYVHFKTVIFSQSVKKKKKDFSVASSVSGAGFCLHCAHLRVCKRPRAQYMEGNVHDLM